MQSPVILCVTTLKHAFGNSNENSKFCSSSDEEVPVPHCIIIPPGNSTYPLGVKLCGGGPCWPGVSTKI